MKKHFIILGSLQAFTALGAIPAGLGYLSDTSGSTMGNSVELLKDSPFPNFLIPGLFLLIVNGFGNVLGAFLTFSRKPIAGISGSALGAILCFWILIQIYLIGLSSFMQPLFLLIGLVELIMGIIIIKKTERND